MMKQAKKISGHVGILLISIVLFATGGTIWSMKGPEQREIDVKRTEELAKQRGNTQEYYRNILQQEFQHYTAEKWRQVIDSESYRQAEKSFKDALFNKFVVAQIQEDPNEVAQTMAKPRNKGYRDSVLERLSQEKNIDALLALKKASIGPKRADLKQTIIDRLVTLVQNENDPARLLKIISDDDILERLSQEKNIDALLALKKASIDQKRADLKQTIIDRLVTLAQTENDPAKLLKIISDGDIFGEDLQKGSAEFRQLRKKISAHLTDVIATNGNNLELMRDFLKTVRSLYGKNLSFEPAFFNEALIESFKNLSNKNLTKNDITLILEIVLYEKTAEDSRIFSLNLGESVSNLLKKQSVINPNLNVPHLVTEAIEKSRNKGRTSWVHFADYLDLLKPFSQEKSIQNFAEELIRSMVKDTESSRLNENDFFERIDIMYRSAEIFGRGDIVIDEVVRLALKNGWDLNYIKKMAQAGPWGENKVFLAQVLLKIALENIKGSDEIVSWLDALDKCTQDRAVAKNQTLINDITNKQILLMGKLEANDFEAMNNEDIKKLQELILVISLRLDKLPGRFTDLFGKKFALLAFNSSVSILTKVWNAAKLRREYLSYTGLIGAIIRWFKSFDYEQVLNNSNRKTVEDLFDSINKYLTADRQTLDPNSEDYAVRDKAYDDLLRELKREQDRIKEAQSKE